MKIYENELFVLSKLLFTKEELDTFVLDPGRICVKNFNSGYSYIHNRSELDDLMNREQPFYLINLSGSGTFTFPLDFSKTEAILSFPVHPEICTYYKAFTLYYTAGKFGRIKWVLSANYKSTAFLLEDEEDRLMVDIKNVISFFPSVMKWIQVKRGNLSKATNGIIQYFTKTEQLIHGIDILPEFQYSFYLPEALSDEVTTIRFEENAVDRMHFRIPNSRTGIEKIRNEIDIISLITGGNPEYLYLPEIRPINDASLLLNFPLPYKKTSYQKLQKTVNERFTKGVFEYINYKLSSLNVLEFLKSEGFFHNLLIIKSRSENRIFPRGLSALKFVKLYTEIIMYLNTIKEDQSILASLSNLELRPEFIGYTSDRVIFTKWLNSKCTHPVLFDLFTYTFNYIKSFANLDSDYLLNDIDYLRKREEVHTLTLNHNFDFVFHLKLYITLNAAQEMVNLLLKKIVQPEENLIIIRWLEVIEHCDQLSKT